MISNILLSSALGLLVSLKVYNPSKRWCFEIGPNGLIIWLTIFVIYNDHVLPKSLQLTITWILIAMTAVMVINIFFNTEDDKDNRTYHIIVMLLCVVLLITGMIMNFFN